MTETTGVETVGNHAVLSGRDILEFQQIVRQVIVSDEIARYAVRLVGRVAAGPAGSARVRGQVREVGRRPARVAGDDSRRQGAGADARAAPRVDQGHPGAGGADPAPPDRHQLLRGIRAPEPRRASSRGCSNPCRCRRAGCRYERAGGGSAAERTAVPRSRGPRAPGHARAEGARRRRRVPVRPAPQPVQGLQRRVRRIPPVPARRRSLHHRLEGLRADRPLLRQEVRGRNQRRLPPAARRQRVDGLRVARHHQAANTARCWPRRWRS